MTSRSTIPDPFDARASLRVGDIDYGYHRLDAVGDRIDLATLPVTIKILLENLLRHAGGAGRRAPTMSRRSSPGGRGPPPRRRSRSCRPGSCSRTSPACRPSSTWPSCATRWPISGAIRALVNPLVPADLVIDHSVQIDQFGTPGAFAFNVEREYDRNGERYQLLRWAQTAFRDLRVVPPGTGIVHQVNLEFLATVITDRDGCATAAGSPIPDTVVGTDSHTTMVNGLGRPRLRRRRHRGGGRPARPAALPADAPRRRRPAPRRAAARLDGDRPRPGRDRAAPGARRGRLVRRVRRRRPGRAGPRRPDDDQQHEPRVRGDLDPLPDRRRDARLPAPDRPLGRAASRSSSATPRTQGLWREPGAGPVFDELLELDLASVTPSVAGPRRPQDRVPLEALRANFRSNFPNGLEGTITELGGEEPVPGDGVVEGSSAESFPASDPPSFASGDADVERRRRRPTRSSRTRRPARSPGVPAGRDRDRRRSAVADPDRLGRDRGDHVLHQHVQPDGDGRRRPARPQRRRPRPARRPDRQDVAGARLARRHRLPRGGRADGAARGARASRWPATAARRASATPGRSTTRSPRRSRTNDLVVAAVLSGNRNFEGRIHPLARASYLASPPLVVAFALAGRVDIDLTTEPLGTGRRRPAGLPRRHLAGARGDPDGHRHVDRPRALPTHLRDRVRGRRPLAGAADPGGRPLRLGVGLDVYRQAAVLRGPPPRTPASRPATRRRCGCSPSSATRSPPTTSPPPGRSRRRHRPASGSRRTASGRSTSTRTARGAAITR